MKASFDKPDASLASRVDSLSEHCFAIETTLPRAELFCDDDDLERGLRRELYNIRIILGRLYRTAKTIDIERAKAEKLENTNG